MLADRGVYGRDRYRDREHQEVHDEKEFETFTSTYSENESLVQTHRDYYYAGSYGIKRKQPKILRR